jgi:hypothetical protein
MCFIEDNFGNDVVFGFADGQDISDFSGETTVTEFAQLTITPTGTGGADTLVTFAGGQLLILASVGLIDESDFSFI